MKSMFWGRAEQYLEENVFEKLEKGETPPEIKTIKESITKAIKRERMKEKTGSIRLQGSEPETFEELTYLDLLVLKAFSEDNPPDQPVEFLDNQKNIQKLREAYNLLTDRQKQIIQLRFFNFLMINHSFYIPNF